MKQWYEALFENYATSYDKEIFTRGTLGECDFLEQELDYDKTKKVLDIGCGTGRHTIELTRRGYNVTGVDLSRDQLAFAENKAAELGLNIRFERQDARDMPFREEFDAAIMLCEGGFSLMETDEMNFAILRNAAAALVPGGKLVFTLLNGLYPLFHSVKDFHNGEAGGSGKVGEADRDEEPGKSGDEAPGHVVSIEEASFDLMTFREKSTITLTDDLGNRKRLHSNERFYVPPEITWLLKSLGFGNIGLFGARLGEFSRSHSLTPEDYEILVIAEKQS